MIEKLVYLDSSEYSIPKFNRPILIKTPVNIEKKAKAIKVTARLDKFFVFIKKKQITKKIIRPINAQIQDIK